MESVKSLTAHQRAVLEQPLEVLVREIESGFDIETIARTDGGGYSIKTGSKRHHPPSVPVCSECNQAPCTGQTLCSGDGVNY